MTKSFAVHKSALKPTKTDAKLITTFIASSKYLYITSTGTKRTKTQNVLSTAFMFSLCLALTVATVLSVKLRNELFVNTLPMPNRIIDRLISISTLSVLIVCFVQTNFANVTEWSALRRQIDELEAVLDNTDFEVRNSVAKTYAAIFTLHVFFFIPHVYQTADWMAGGYYSLSLSYAVNRLGDYYSFFMDIFMVVILTYLRRRYDYLNDSLRRTFTAKVTTVRQKEEEMRMSRRVLLMLLNIVERFNSMLGWNLFVSNFRAVTYILSTLGLIIISISQFPLKNFLLSLAFALFNALSTVFLVMACDGVQKTSKKLAKICYYLQEDNNTQNDLEFLAKYSEELSPSFTAAGLYQINQGLLSTIFSTVATYIIMIIQFNATPCVK